MSSHPLFVTALSIGAFIYISAAFFMVQVLNARAGYEDENGFHFADTIEDVVVPADEVRPTWFTNAMAERFSGHRPELFS